MADQLKRVYRREWLLTEAYCADLSGGVALLDIVAVSSLASSRREARERIKSGAIYINGAVERDPARLIGEADLRNEAPEELAHAWQMCSLAVLGRLAVLRAVWVHTKHGRHLIHVVEEEEGQDGP